MKRKPTYPSSALFHHLVGTVIMSVDIDQSGSVSNPHILAAVPLKPFGDAVLNAIDGLKFLPGQGWDAKSCSLAHQGHVVSFNFEIAH